MPGSSRAPITSEPSRSLISSMSLARGTHLHVLDRALLHSTAAQLGLWGSTVHEHSDDSHSVEHLLEHLHPLFFFHTGLLRELFVFACCWLCSCFMGSWVPTPDCLPGPRGVTPGTHLTPSHPHSHSVGPSSHLVEHLLEHTCTRCCLVTLGYGDTLQHLQQHHSLITHIFAKSKFPLPPSFFGRISFMGHSEGLIFLTPPLCTLLLRSKLQVRRLKGGVRPLGFVFPSSVFPFFLFLYSGAQNVSF